MAAMRLSLIVAPFLRLGNSVSAILRPVRAGCLIGYRGSARKREASASEPWEQVVNLCLRALAGEGCTEPAATMTGAYLAFSDPGHPWFTACLGLIVAELAGPGDGRHAAIGKAASIATESRDAYIAREIVTSFVAGDAAPETLTALNDVVFQSGLGQPMTAVQEKRLTASASAAAALLAARLPTGV